MNQIIEGEQIRVEVDLENGARLSSVQWEGYEFSVQKRESVLHWGWYPLAPWGGRIPFGKMRRRNGIEVQLPTNLTPPHAIHGLAFDRQWVDLGNGASQLRLPAPYDGAVVETRISVSRNLLNYELEYFAGECDLPAWLGLHTWFPRRIGEEIGEVEVIFDAEAILSMDESFISQGEFLSPIPPQPWDDVFFKPKSHPITQWRDGAKIEIKSTRPWWIIYTKDSEGVCVEPQTAPPNAQNLEIDLSQANLLQVQFVFSKD
jgi:aldose 1-epimerase